jgi:hypothetical protein
VEHQNGHGYPYIDVGTRSFNGFSIHPSYLLYPNRLLIATKESAIAIMVNTLQIRMLEEITAKCNCTPSHCLLHVVIPIPP